MRLVSEAELAGLVPAEFDAFPGPIPTRIVPSEEFLPVRQTAARTNLRYGYVTRAQDPAVRTREA